MRIKLLNNKAHGVTEGDGGKAYITEVPTAQKSKGDAAYRILIRFKLKCSVHYNSNKVC